MSRNKETCPGVTSPFIAGPVRPRVRFMMAGRILHTEAEVRFLSSRMNSPLSKANARPKKLRITVQTVQTVYKPCYKPVSKPVQTVQTVNLGIQT